MAKVDEELAALLEIARDIAIRYNIKFSLAVLDEGRGLVNNYSSDTDVSIGYREPKEKALLEER